MSDDLPVPFDAAVHRPARVGYQKEKRRSMVKALAAAVVRIVGR